MNGVTHDQGLVAIEVPADVAEAVNARINSGEYANQGDVARNGLRLLSEEDETLRNPEVEQWLRTIVVPVGEATLTDPSRSKSADEVRAHFASAPPPKRRSG